VGLLCHPWEVSAFDQSCGRDKAHGWQSNPTDKIQPHSRELAFRPDLARAGTIFYYPAPILSALASIVMPVTRSCILGVILLALVTSGCASALFGPMTVAADKRIEAKSGDDLPETPKPPATFTNQARPLANSDLQANAIAGRTPTNPVAAGQNAEGDQLKLGGRDGPAELADLERALNSPDSTLPPQYKARLREQLLAIVAGKEQTTIPIDRIHPDRRPGAVVPASHASLPGPQETPVSIASPANRFNISHRLTEPATPEVKMEPGSQLAAASLPVNKTLDRTANVNDNSTAPDASITANTAEVQPSDAKEFQRGEWRTHLTKTLDSLEAELKKYSPSDHEGELLATSARLLHVVANHREQAVEAIDKLDEDEREFWKHQLHALLVAIDAEDKHAGGRWAALVLRELQAASDHLANVSALDVRNLAFCSKVDSFGTYTPFKSTAFKPGQSILLYVEIDNFSVEQVGDIYRTELLAEYTIVDAAGTRINSKLPVVKEECRNRRHDYFIAYELLVPKDLPAGKYALQLVVEDVKGQKSSQASIDFSVR
jgi:hypothetical protein